MKDKDRLFSCLFAIAVFLSTGSTALSQTIEFVPEHRKHIVTPKKFPTELKRDRTAMSLKKMPISLSRRESPISSIDELVGPAIIWSLSLLDGIVDGGNSIEISKVDYRTLEVEHFTPLATNKIRINVNLSDGTFTIPGRQVLRSTEFGEYYLCAISDDYYVEIDSPIAGYIDDYGSLIITQNWADISEADDGYYYSEGIWGSESQLILANGIMQDSHSNGSESYNVLIAQSDDKKTVSVINFGGYGQLVKMKVYPDKHIVIPCQVGYDVAPEEDSDGESIDDFYTYAADLNGGYYLKADSIIGTISSKNISFGNWALLHDRKNGGKRGYWYYDGTITLTHSGVIFGFPEEEREPYCTLSTLSLSFSADGGSQTIEVSSNQDWTFSSSQPWLKCSPSSGYGNATITVTVDPNYSVEARKGYAAVVVDTPNSYIGLRIDIHQEGAEPYITCDQSEISVKVVGGEQTVNLESNAVWTAESAEDWIYIDPNSGNASTAVTIKVAVNASTAPREGIVTFTAKNGYNTKSFFVIVKQKGAELSISCGQAELVVPAVGGEQTVNLESNAVWTATSAEDWITVDPGSGEAGAEDVKIKVKENTSTEPREGKVTFTAKFGDNTKSFEVTVTQAGAELSITCNQAELVVPAVGGDHAVRVTSNASWEATSSAEGWITVDPGSGDAGTKDVKISVKENTSTKPREAIITFIAKDGDNEKSVEVTVKQAGADLSITCNQAELEVPAVGGDQAVRVTSNASWEATSVEDWVTVEPGSGEAGTKDVKIKVKENTSTNPREGIVIFTANDGKNINSYFVTVKQEGAGVSISCGQAELVVPAAGEDETVSVTANAAWTATSSAEDWITVDPGSGDAGAKDVKIKVKENTSTKPREGKITFTAKDGDNEKSVEVTVKQTGAELSINCDSGELEDFAAEGGEQTVNVTANAEWTATSAEDWITVDPGSGDAGTKDVKITVKENTSTKPREGKITFTAKDGDNEKSVEVTVTQAGAELFITCEQTELTVPASGGDQSVVLMTNAEWKAESNDKWISVDPDSGDSETGRVTIKVEENTSTELREGTVIFTAKDDDTKSFEVTVAQAGTELFITCEQTELTVPASGGDQSVVLMTNAEWKAESNDKWISVDPDSGDSETGRVTIKVEENTSTELREGTVIFTAKDDDTKSFEVKVTQAGAELFITCEQTELKVPAVSGDQAVSVTSNAEWTASSAEDWITVEPKNGNAGTEMVTIKIEENTSADPREGKVTFIAKDGEKTNSVVVTVTQEGAELSISCYPTSIPPVVADGGKYTVVLKSNADWTATTDQEWITVVQQNGTPGDSILVHYMVSENASTEERTGIVTFTAKAGDSTKPVEVKVTQKGQDIYISLNPNEWNYAPEGESKDFTITTNTNWKVTGKSDWITVDPERGNLSDKNVKVSVTANPKMEERSGFVVFTAGEGKNAKTDTLKVTQMRKAYDLDIELSQKELTLSPDGIVNKTIKVYTIGDVSYEIEKGNEDWIHLGSVSDAKEVMVRVDPNMTTSEREGKVVFIASKDGDSKSDTLTITQEAVSIVGSPIKLDSIPAKGGYESVTIVSNVKWKLDDSIPEWIKVSPDSADAGKATVLIQVMPNESTETRNCTISFNGMAPDGSEYKSNSWVYTIYQQAAELQPFEYFTDAANYELYPATKTATILAVKAMYDDVVVPESIVYNDQSYIVTAIAEQALAVGDGFNYSVSLPATITTIDPNAFDKAMTSAIIWNSDTPLPTNAFENIDMVTWKNMLLYVKRSGIAPVGFANTIVDGKAQDIILYEGAVFHCPQEFAVRTISFSHEFTMETGMGITQGWETIALPFDVQTITHATKGHVVPFAIYSVDSDSKPFWLYEWTNQGFIRASSMDANNPYLISMPNNVEYSPKYNLPGIITFAATDAMVNATKSESIHSYEYQNKYFWAKYYFLGTSNKYANINSINNLRSDSGGYTPGSIFIKNFRNTWPFEGYIYDNSENASSRNIIEIEFADESETTGIEQSIVATSSNKPTMGIYTIAGQRIIPRMGMTDEELLQRLPAGVYIVNGEKVVVK